jgi:hypothetical protein
MALFLTKYSALVTLTLSMPYRWPSTFSLLELPGQRPVRSEPP